MNPALNLETNQARIKFFKKNEKEYLKAQPKLKNLKTTLLAIGGDFICMTMEEDLEKIISRGEVFKGRGSIMMKGRPSQCHSNSAELWDVNQGKLELVTGYALSIDEDELGVWRPHTWLVSIESGKVIETTVKRKTYFGFRMNKEESEKFVDDNY